MRLGDRIQAERKARGWTQRELAERSTISKGYIIQLENNQRENPTRETLQKLAVAFSMTVDALLTGAPTEDLTTPPRALLQEAGYTAKLIDDLVESWPRQSHDFRLKVVTAARRRVQEAHDLYGAIL